MLSGTETIPADTNVEAALLGNLIITENNYVLFAAQLKKDYFSCFEHQLIFEAIKELTAKKVSVDLVTLRSYLSKAGKLAEAGGTAYVISLAEHAIKHANIEAYLAILKEKYIKRVLIDTTAELSQKAFNPETSAEEVLALAQEKMGNIARDEERKQYLTAKELSFSMLDQIGKYQDGIQGIATGFSDLDKLLLGIPRQSLTILAARPSVGKTAFSINLALNVARKNINVAFFSLEMSAEEIGFRLISNISLLNAQKIKTGKLSNEENERLQKTLGEISELSLYIDDQSALKPLELKAKVNRMSLEKKIDLVIIDYLQLMRSSIKNDNRFLEVSEVVREIKGIAKDLEIPVIALSQLSRDVEKRMDKTPLLSDLRESGEIEQTADIVMFLSRDEEYEQMKALAEDNNTPEAQELKKNDVLKLSVAKHRNGPVGSLRLVFRKDVSRFYNFV